MCDEMGGQGEEGLGVLCYCDRIDIYPIKWHSKCIPVDCECTLALFLTRGASLYDLKPHVRRVKKKESGTIFCSLIPLLSVVYMIKIFKMMRLHASHRVLQNYEWNRFG